MSKIQELIDQGVITKYDVINYWNMLTDEYDEQMIAQAQEEDDMDYQEGDIDFTKDFDKLLVENRNELFKDIISGEYNPDPQYVVLSTSHYMKETYVFGSDENGNITSWSEITGLAKRWDSTDNYLDTEKVLEALNEVTGHSYTFVKDLCDNREHKQLLYKRDDV